MYHTSPTLSTPTHHINCLSGLFVCCSVQQHGELTTAPFIDFYRHVTDRPTKQQRIELAEQVRHIPGCEGYTSADVTGYFSRKRQAMAARPPSDEARHQPDTAAPSLGMETVKICMLHRHVCSRLLADHARCLVCDAQCVRVSRKAQNRYNASKFFSGTTLIRPRRSLLSGPSISGTARRRTTSSLTRSFFARGSRIHPYHQ